jgi:hypothetical protein
MDFVISKVAMSICALMVVSVLSGMFAKDTLFNSGGELEDILRDFCTVVDEIAVSGTDARVSWIVPFTSQGGAVFVELRDFVAHAESGSDKALDQPACRIRTWTYDGDFLNSTMLASLDGELPILRAHSSQAIHLISKTLAIDGQQKRFVFAEL